MANAVYDRMTKPKGPHAWMQWKGTSFCADIRCNCGVVTHLDGGGTSTVKCGACGKIYALNGHVELVELHAEEIKDPVLSSC